MKNSKFFRRSIRNGKINAGIAGQAMIEFVLIVVTLLATVAIFAVFFYVFKRNSARILDLIAYPYP